MKEELTREVVESMSVCSHNVGCKECAALYFCNGKMWSERCKRFASALLEEMDKPRVWDGAPEWANAARVRWSKPDYPVVIDEFFSEIYTRELPKTRARQIAEEVTALVNRAIDGISVEEIESVLNKYAEELKGEE